MSVIMSTVTTHPSVRLKGAENIYDPVVCQDSNCAKRYVTHMHCPFCVRTEFFTDPVILKAHYRVKHVDKGIEFAGLKIVRCCDHCDIVGSIKGSKEIKGAHWHCFRCKNGFNRRDEALKHYRTHFRNAQTTFQIHIAQDVNQTLAANSLPNDLPSAQDIIAGTERAVDGIVAVSDDRCLQVSVAANETVDTTTSGDLPTFMVLPATNSLADVIQVDSRQEVKTTIFNLCSEAASSSSPSDVCSQQHPQPLVGTNHQNVNPDQTSSTDADAAQLQIQQLQQQVKKQTAEIEALKRREAELVRQLEVPLDDCIVQLLQKMKAEHEQLLQHQLDLLRMEYLRHIAPSPSATPCHGPPLSQPVLILSGSNGQRFRIIPTIAKLAPETGSLGFTTFTSGPGLLSGILPSQDGEVAEGEEGNEGKHSGNLVEDGLVSEHFIVAADDMSEYVDAEVGTTEHAELMHGDDGNDLDTDEDAVNIQESSETNKRRADQPDCCLSLKRERLQEELR